CFVKNTVDLPSLHAFPTRRSSDLTKQRVSLQKVVLAPRAAAVQGRTPCEKVKRFILLLGAMVGIIVSSRGQIILVCPIPFIQARDRKSTRLNSSHVSISYAVFCLK